jgi:hypothetical protein
MTSRKFRRALSFFALCTATALLPPRLAAQSVLQAGDLSVEVVGLRRWTVEMIQDSLARYSPGVSLQDHACAAVLRYRLGFADAASTRFLDGPSTYIVVSVVEPQDSARVRHRILPQDTIPVRREWAEAADVARRWPGFFQVAVLEYAAARPGRQPRFPPGADSAAVHRVWRFLRNHRGPRDFVHAADAISRDSSLYNRVVAAAILANFTHRDSAWWLLVDALRETEGPVRAIAGTVLASAAWAQPRKVDWGPAEPAIHAILDGTGLFELRNVMNWLPTMGADSRWNAEFLAGGGEMVLAYLQAEHAPTRESAHQFLVAMRGADLGTEVEPWRAWIASLGTRVPGT